MPELREVFEQTLQAWSESEPHDSTPEARRILAEMKRVNAVLTGLHLWHRFIVEMYRTSHPEDKNAPWEEIEDRVVQFTGAVQLAFVLGWDARGTAEKKLVV